MSFYNENQVNDYLVKVYMNTPKAKDGKVQWQLMADKIHKEKPEILAGVYKPRKWLAHRFDSKAMQKKIQEYKKPQMKAKAKNGDMKVLSEETTREGLRSKSVELWTDKDISLMTDVEIIRLLGFDPEYCQLVSSTKKLSEWDAQSADGEINQLHSYRISGTVKPLKPGEVSMDMVKNVLIDAMREEKLMSPVKEKKPIGDKIAIVSIADLHLGKLAWAPECGESYDYKIAIRRFNQIVNESVDRIKKEGGVEKIVFFWSQDFFHFDTTDVTTTAGTHQDSDMRWQKMFSYGSRILIEALERLAAIAPVETFYVRSNHDTQTAYYATEMLGAYFHENPNVLVDVHPSPRHYIRYGVNLLGFGHGDKEKKRIHSMMSIEAPKDWGETINHEFFLGHYHSQRTFEENGVICRYLASPTGPDAWHCESGFIGAQKGAQLFIRGKETGMMAEYFISVK